MLTVSIAALATLVAANTVVLCRMVRRGGRPHPPPRSHADDMFDPRIRV